MWRSVSKPLPYCCLSPSQVSKGFSHQTTQSWSRLLWEDTGSYPTNGVGAPRAMLPWLSPRNRGCCPLAHVLHSTFALGSLSQSAIPQFSSDANNQELTSGSTGWSTCRRSVLTLPLQVYSRIEQNCIVCKSLRRAHGHLSSSHFLLPRAGSAPLSSHSASLLSSNSCTQSQMSLQDSLCSTKDSLRWTLSKTPRTLGLCSQQHGEKALAPSSLSTGPRPQE